ncbi:MAG: DeoR family transcriptional regulator [Actinobacteria bacterium]|nr:DeoR family transcriptional regulator [Actinomycetota bacterium]
MIELLEQHGSVSITYLSDYFNISKVTIRRHIDKLAEEITPIKRARGAQFLIKLKPHMNHLKKNQKDL